MMNDRKVYCYGELLWDCFPEKEILGGAPFNVAYRLHNLGASVALISAVGYDTRGQDALRGLSQFGLSTNTTAVHAELPTGYVEVHLDNEGAATYTIAEPVAWDKIPADEIKIEPDSLLIFGSLALRRDYNKQQIDRLLTAATLSVFDINLRPPHYRMGHLIDLVKKCDCLKLNEEELILLIEDLNIKADGLEEQMMRISHNTTTPTICVTLGGEGAALYHNGLFYRHPGFPAKVADTVGAGDAFLAGFVHALFISKTTPEAALEFGCALGSLVASSAGATAPVAVKEIDQLINK